MLKIRNAKLEDVERICELLYFVHDVHAKIRSDLFKEGMRKYNEEDVKSLLINPNYHIFVCVDDDLVVGYAITIDHLEVETSSTYEEKSLYIDDLCVDKTCVKQGIGKTLYEYVKQYATTHHYDTITLNVYAKNTNALSFYKHIGLSERKIIMEEKLK